MVTLNTAKIDRQIKKLEELKKLALDPEMVSLFFEMVSGDSNTTSPEIKRFPRLRTEGSKRGELEGAAKRMLPSLPEKFGSSELVRTLTLNGYTFSAKKPNVAISGVLKRLVKKGVLKRVDVGGGKRNAKYQRA